MRETCLVQPRGRLRVGVDGLVEPGHDAEHLRVRRRPDVELHASKQAVSQHGGVNSQQSACMPDVAVGGRTAEFIREDLYQSSEWRIVLQGQGARQCDCADPPAEARTSPP